MGSCDIMKFRDKNSHLTKEAIKISDKISDALEPIFEECIRGGMSLEEFYYLVSITANEMILFAIFDGKRLERLIKGNQND